MKKFILSWIYVILFGFIANSAPKVAVFVDGPIDESDKFIIESRVGSALSGGKYTVLERTQSFIDMVTREQAYQLSGEVAPSEISAFGERWGCTSVIAIYVVESRGSMVATAKIINVKTGQVACTVSNHRVIRSMDDLIVFAATLGVNIKREMSKIRIS